MRTCSAELTRIEPGCVEIALNGATDLTQQHGFLHGGVVGAILDTACGYAALSLMDDQSAVLTVEYKINFLAPADATRFRIAARVIRPGRTLTLTEGDAFAVTSAGEIHIAAMRATMIATKDRGLED